LKLGEERDDAILRFMGLRYSGQTCLYLAEFGEARARSEKALALYDPTHRRSLENAHAATLCDISRELLCLGYLDQARIYQDQALAEARKLSEGYTLAYSLASGRLLGAVRSIRRRLRRASILANINDAGVICIGGGVLARTSGLQRQ